MLYDVYCEKCNLEKYDVWIETKNFDKLIFFCNGCNKNTTHGIVLNGGSKKRYRYNDFSNDPRDYRGQVKVTGVEAVDSNGEPVRDLNGKRIDSYYKYTDEARGERRERRYHEEDRRRGRTPIFMDMKK